MGTILRRTFFLLYVTVIQDPTFMLGITHTIPLLELCSRDMTIMKIKHTHKRASWNLVSLQLSS